MLLPKEVNDEGDEEDPRLELVEQLLQYKMYKYMSFELRDRESLGDLVLYKGPDIPDEVKAYEQPVDLDELLAGVTIDKLNEVFLDVMKRINDKVDPVRSSFGKIEKEEVTLSDKLSYIQEYAKTNKKFGFRQLLETQGSKMHVVVAFLAILELMKIGEIEVVQETVFDEIWITAVV